MHVILLFPLPSHEIAPGKKKNDQRRRLRRDQCFTIHKRPSMLPDQREEIVLETASSPLPRRLLPKRVVHVPFWFFSFLLFPLSSIPVPCRCEWPWLGYGCFNHVRLPMRGSLPVMQTCYILGLCITGSEGSGARAVKTLHLFYRLLDQFWAMLDRWTPSTNSSGTD